MDHVVMFSGGGGSKSAAKRVKNKVGKDNLFLLFTDTLIEDKDTYRYMIESAASLYDLPKPYSLMLMCEKIPDIKSDDDIEERKRLLPILAIKTMKFIPNFVWLQESRTPWEIFKEKRYIGNSRTAQCSGVLKQDPARDWVEGMYMPNQVILYVGIDWTEIHRFEGNEKKIGIRKSWLPYITQAPMTEAPYQDKLDMQRADKEEGLRKQRLYVQGFAHANCGGFCVRGGQGHFINLLKQNKDYYLYNEGKEQAMREFLDREDLSILTRTVNSVEQTLTLKQLREEWESGLANQIDMDDIGGCGCFSAEEV